MLKKAVVYIRVSDPSQIENNSLDTQEKACSLYAHRNGYEVISLFREAGISAKNTNREALKKLLVFCYLKKNLVDAVIVYKLNRWSRSTEDGLALEAYLSKRGIQVLSATEPVAHDPIGKFNRTILYASGQLENEMKGLVVKDNMLSLFRKGIWCWKCPVGYKRPFDSKEKNKGKAPVSIPELSEIIIAMFNEAATGIYSRQQLARKMNERGFDVIFGSKATIKMVIRIAKNSFYYGEMYCKKWNEYSTGLYEPIIDKQTWQIAHSKLFGGKRKYKIQDNFLYPLKGILKCEDCQNVMTSSNPRGRSKQYYHYECGNKKCRSIRIDVEKAHIEFMKLLHSLRPTPRVIKLFVHMVFSEWDNVINTSKKEISSIDERIKYYEDELRIVGRSLDKRIYTEDMAQKESERINLELMHLNVRRSDIQIDQYDAEKVKNFTEYFLLNLDDLWLRLDSLSMKQALQKKIFPEGIYCTKNKKIRTIALAPSFALIDTLSRADVTIGDPKGIRTPDSQDENLVS